MFSPRRSRVFAQLYSESADHILVYGQGEAALRIVAEPLLKDYAILGMDRGMHADSQTRIMVTRRASPSRLVTKDKVFY